MSVLSKNLEEIRKTHPGLEEATRPLLDEEEGEQNRNSLSRKMALEDTPSGNPTLLYRGRYLHSRRDPVREAARLAESQIDGAAGCYVIGGFGLGYLAEEVLKRTCEVSVLVYEPNVSLFYKALEARDMTGFIGAVNLSFFLGTDAEAVISVLNGFSAEAVRALLLRAYYEIEPEALKPLEAALAAYRSRQEINTNTLTRFGKRWIRNLAANLPVMAAASPLEPLRRSCTGLPAVVFAAGPSLDLINPYLREIKKRCITIAVDTSLRWFKETGEEPDFLVVVDPQYWNSRHLDRLEAPHSLLVSESSTYPAVFRRAYRDILFCSSLFPLGEYLEGYTEIEGKLGAGGSVSTSAWDLARFLGASEIFMAGLDLGFPEKQTHYRGSMFEERAHFLSRRTLTAEEMNLKYITEADPEYQEDNQGGEVLTDRRLLLYRWWFENQMKQHRDRKTFSLSPRGIALEGIPFKPVEELLSYPVARGEIDARLGTVPDTISGGPISTERRLQPDKKRPEGLKSGLIDLLEELKGLRKLAKQGAGESEKLLKAFRAGGPTAAMVETLNEIDSRIASSVSKDIAGFLLRKLLDSIAGGGSLGQEEDLRRSVRLYRELAASAQFHREVLSRAAQRL